MNWKVFSATNNFTILELSWANNGGAYGHIHYQRNLRWEELTLKEQQAAKFVINNIHGLPFNHQEAGIASLIGKLKDHVKELYQKAKTSEKWIVAYKGGHLERDLLKELNIPTVNLEDLGCPYLELLSGQHRIDPIPDSGHGRVSSVLVIVNKTEEKNWETS